MRVNQFQWVLFDADETLFHFDAYAGLRLMFSKYNVQFSQDDFEQYQKVNKPLWHEYQNGTIDANTLQTTRFNAWAKKLNCSTEELNSGFLTAMADICQPLPGAREMVDAISDKVNLGIITNGFTQLQSIRLERTGFMNDFEHVVISEQVGVAKPDKAIFEHSLALMGKPDPKKVLMVGDNIDSDILGGNNAGMHTCWLNHDQQPVPDEIKPTHHVASLSELTQWLLSSEAT
ncbi:pyrimidine 5'-nucleotidase [Shewanella maritima]|uniref:pyrimidine 5'-nucleotidase n=1 Tax=Shewanella maritima TaxID=2520507 RepID=UPI003736B9E9